MSEYERFSQGYEELLQIPLQPLKDNLDNSTYEVRVSYWWDIVCLILELRDYRGD